MKSALMRSVLISKTQQLKLKTVKKKKKVPEYFAFCINEFDSSMNFTYSKGYKADTCWNFLWKILKSVHAEHQCAKTQETLQPVVA